MLYKESHSAGLSEELFKNPANAFRGAPFWAWNCKVTPEECDNTISDLEKMGMGGAHIHSRTGMDIPYLSEEFMELVKYANQKCKEHGMYTWLYDEDRWPSGFAGGKVTQNNRYRQRFLVLSPEPIEETGKDSFGKAMEAGQRIMLGKYAVGLKDGYLSEYHLLKEGETAADGSDVWYLYKETAGNDPWFNNQAYVDTLNKEAIDRFIEITHEAYYRLLGEEFGKSVPAIFTDEPQFCRKFTLGYAGEKRKIILPFTDDFPDTYKAEYHDEFLETLPECIWNLPDGKLSVHRYRYHDHISKRFTEAFADNIGSWCDRHGIALTGHMMEEPTLYSQTVSLGEAMRSYRAFTIPGIDMLFDSRELTTAKQAQSVVHQYGREGMMSEIYGVTNWDFDFRGHKLAGDWQAALGVTLRVHHLNWTSMAGEAKRDYPAPIGQQSPWYEEYPLIEDHFARVNTALTRGKASVKVGVVHPIESYWLYWGASEQTQGIREEMDENFKRLTEYLLFGLIDFDFISEALWKEETPDEVLGSDQDFLVGEMKYEVILVPNCVTIRRSTLKRLEAFQKKGGKVIFIGRLPDHIDGLSDPAGLAFAQTCQVIDTSRNQILEAVKGFRELDVRNGEGARTHNLIHQIRNDGADKWLFLAHCYKMKNPDLPQKEELTIDVKGIYHPMLYDTMTGRIEPIDYRIEKGHTLIAKSVYDHDSILLQLRSPHIDRQEKPWETEKSEEIVKFLKTQESVHMITLPDYVEMQMEEPNVLVMDMAEAKFDDEDWQPLEDILHIDNILRKRVGYPLRADVFPQPWINSDSDDVKHRLSLRFSVYSEIAVDHLLLALENAEQTDITWNGSKVASVATGYYVDRAIKTIQVPGLKPGRNLIVADMPYYHRFSVEPMYLLGDFGVKVMGKNAVLTQPCEKIAFGDICTQGLPFYGGNLIYRLPVDVIESGRIEIEITRFRCPLISAAIDGRECGKIAFSPYRISIEGVAAGPHIVELKAYGNRINTFGALHNCNSTDIWMGSPNSYRTANAEWAYEYQLKPSGILVSPRIMCEKNSRS